MKTKINGVDCEGDFHPSCIRLTNKAIETINELQAGGTLLTKVHADKDFDDCGIRSTVELINEIADFIFSIYTWKMNDLEGSDKDDFAIEILHNLHQLQYLKHVFNSFRVRPKPDEF